MGQVAVAVSTRSVSRTGGPRDPRKMLSVGLAMMWAAGFVSGVYFADWVKLVIA